MTTHTVSELYEKRNELAGQIIQTEKLAKQLRADITSIDNAIRVMRPGAELPKIIPRHDLSVPQSTYESGYCRAVADRDG
jgi:hypothetical protein